MDNYFTRAPMSEVHRSRRFRYDAALFESSSSYFEPLKEAEKLTRRQHPNLDKQDWKRLRTLLVHECEQSKQWARLWELKDDPQKALDEWHGLTRGALSPLISRLSELSKLDEHHGYQLRHAFEASVQFAMSPDELSDVWLPNINLENNGFYIPTGGPVAQQVELRFAGRLFLARFQEWIGNLEAQIAYLGSGFELGRRIGPMWLDPPLTRRQVLKRSSEQLAILALIARLRAIFRRIVCPNYDLKSITLDSICGDLPANGAACWQVVTLLAQSVFPEISESSILKRRWSDFQKGRSIRLAHWPEAVTRLESANQKKA